MKYLVEPYIYPIMDDNICVGQGFVADGYFITAAHVIKEYPECYVMSGGNKVALCKHKYEWGRKTIDAYFVGKGDTYKDANQIDVVLYKWDNCDSPLHLNLHEPKGGEFLKSHCVEPLFDSKTNTYYNKYSIEDALVLGEEEGNYFYCRCRRFPSSSGSPLLWGNQVVGIMHGGNPDDELCAFLKIESFIFNTDIQVPYDKIGLAKDLLDGDIELTTAKYILYALHYDLGFINVALLEDMTETGLYMCLNRLPFNIYELKEYEKEALIEYCQSLVQKMVDNGIDSD